MFWQNADGVCAGEAVSNNDAVPVDAEMEKVKAMVGFAKENGRY